MDNDFVSNIVGLLQGLKSDATNLSKSLDDKDPREETGGDLTALFSRFGEIKDLTADLDESEITQLQEELKKLTNGQEDVQTYARDVTNILASVKQRIAQHAPTKQKIIDNLPTAQKQANVGSLFDSWGSVLTNVSNLLGQPKIGSR